MIEPGSLRGTWRSTVAACTILACVNVTIAAAQSDREGRLSKQEVRESRTKAEPLDRPVAKKQRIYLPRPDTANTEVLGDHWKSEDEKRAALEEIRSLTETQIRNRLVGLGYKCTFDPDGSELKVATEPDAVVLVSTLDQAGHGKEHPVIAITVIVRDAKDPNQIYGKFSDGGMVGQVTMRIANRFRFALLKEEP